MKKFIALFVCMTMLFSVCAFAEESVEETADDMTREIYDAEEITGISAADWEEVTLADSGITFKRPAGMTDAADIEAETEMIASAATESGDYAYVVYKMFDSSNTIDDVVSFYDEQGDNTEIDGDNFLPYEHVYVSTLDTDNADLCSVVVQGADGYWYEFSINGETDPMIDYFNVMMSTLTVNAQ